MANDIFGTGDPNSRKAESKVYQDAYGQYLAAHAGQPDAQQGAQAFAAEASGKYSQVQDKTLEQGQTYRDGLDSPNDDYLAYDHEQLYQWAHDDASAETVDQQAIILNDLSNMLGEAAQHMNEASNSEYTAWQGQGASAVHGYAKNSAEWLTTAQQSTALAENHTSQQAAAVSHAQTAMPQPVPFDQKAEFDGAVKQWAGGDFSGAMDTMQAMPAKEQASRDAHQQAVDALNTRDTTYHDTGSTMPAYSAPPAMASPDSTHASSAISAPASSGGHAAIPNVSGGVPAGTPGLTGAPGSPVSSGPGLAGSSVSTGSGYVPGGAGTSAPGGQTFTPRPSTGLGTGGLTAGLGATGTGTGRTGDIERTSRGGPGTSFRGSGGSGGGKGGSAAGRLHESGEGKSAGAGSRTGAGVPGEKEGVARGGAAAANKAGASSAGAGGAGAGRGGKDEDKEKKRTVPLTEDADETYGANVDVDEFGNRIAPPVIGG